MTVNKNTDIILRIIIMMGIDKYKRQLYYILIELIQGAVTIIDLYAHILINSDGEKIYHTLCDHLNETALYASKSLENIGLFNTGFLAGIIHDQGKAKQEFQDYLVEAVNGEKINGKKVIHSHIGLIYLLDNYSNFEIDDMKNKIYPRLTAEILAYSVGSHHGLFDCKNLDLENIFEERKKYSKDNLYYKEAVDNFEKMYSKEYIDDLFVKSCAEIRDFTKKFGLKIYDKSIKENQRFFFIGMLTRLITSAVINGDRKSTAIFMKQINRSNEYNSIELWHNQLDFLNHKIESLDVSKKYTDINKARMAISNYCYSFADKESGIYRLNVPTGAGKTLSTLRYALRHAEVFDKKRIFFIIPLLTITEQNAEVIRESIKDKDIVLEHHSNVVKIPDNNENDDINYQEMLLDTWESPMIITTLVQFLNTLFKDKTTCVRRMQALVNSVIIIDEVQTIPIKTMYLFTSVMNFLNKCCNTTVILCSATQPEFGELSYPMDINTQEIIPQSIENKWIFDAFKRTELIDSCKNDGFSIEELAVESIELIAQKKSLLVVCNTKKSAKELFEKIKTLCDEETLTFHLSTSMCVKHRQDILRIMTEKLIDSQQKVICVSTQLIEAGVDISFDSVIRVAAGMDNIVQAAGRCHRNGGKLLGEVRVVNLNNSCESLKKLPDIDRAKGCTLELISEYKKHTDFYENDLSSKKSISAYYSKLYSDSNIRKEFSYRINGLDYTMIDLLSKHGSDKFILNQPFKTAGNLFNVFEDETTDVLVPYNNESEAIIRELNNQDIKYDFEKKQRLIQQAKRYIIHLFNYQMEEYKDYIDKIVYKNNSGKVMSTIYVLSDQCYNKETGFGIEFQM